MHRTTTALLTTAAAVLAAAALAPASEPTLHAARTQTTTLISRSTTGGVPDGPSTNPVISGDRRYARVIAFQSAASNLVAGDTNGRTDVFAIERGGTFANEGTPWVPGKTILVSRGLGGKPANGPSFAPDVDGNFRTAPRCVAFLSAASNLVKGDTNGRVDAFVSHGPGESISRLPLPGGKQPTAAATGVAVSGDCSHAAFVAGGALYTRAGGATHRVTGAAHPADPSFAQGETNDLVFGADGGVYMSRDGTGAAKRIATGGRNPAYNAIKRQVVAYEKHLGTAVQVMWRDLGQPEHVASSTGGSIGDRDSRNPVVVNSGYYVGFESDATNLGATPGTQAYLYTDVRKLTQVRSVDNAGAPLPGGGRHPAVSFYANYILFSSPAPLGAASGADQIFMRYLGGK